MNINFLSESVIEYGFVFYYHNENLKRKNSLVVRQKQLLGPMLNVVTLYAVLCPSQGWGHSNVPFSAFMRFQFKAIIPAKHLSKFLFF